MKTGADGRVTVRVPTGGSVSTLATYSGLSDGTAYTYRYVQTFGAPPNGAVLEAGPIEGLPSAVTPPENLPMTVVLNAMSAADAPVGTTRFEVQLPCDGQSPVSPGQPFTRTSFKGCRGETTYDVIVFAQTAARKNLGYALLLDQPLVVGTTATFSVKPQKTTFIEVDTTLSEIPDGSAKARIYLYGYRGGSPARRRFGVLPTPLRRRATRRSRGSPSSLPRPCCPARPSPRRSPRGTGSMNRPSSRRTRRPR